MDQHSSEGCLAGPCEPLERHLLEVAECARKVGIDVARKLARVFGVEFYEALDVLSFAALVHDVGKASVEPENGGRYFPGHEAASTTFAYEVVLKAFDNKIVPICGVGFGINANKRADGLNGLFTATLWAIALHHYYKRYVGRRAAPFVRLCKSYLDALEQWTPLTELGKVLKNTALKIDKIKESDCHARIVESLNRQPHKRLSYATSAILGVLGECDNEIARRNRCD